ncbi:MAG: LysR substrate-binding domain-containing protein [Bdellovibrionales bacterium]|jgi:LysR family hydrogen peroxide-inducible transcriptional activator|nr:LysR substrate-binding domain-containing protein [Bdellovibrionales bacterium]
MNLRDLEYILAVAEKRHFGLAAEACHVSQPALSTQIRKLEDELGLRLFDRTTREVAPTVEAQFILDHARRILENAGEIKKYARLHREGRQTKIINLGVIPTIAPYYLPDFFARVGKKARAQNINWQIHEEKTERLMAQLQEGKLDAAIVSLPVRSDGLKTRKLFTEPFYLAVPTGHPYAGLSAVEAGDIDGAEWLLLDDGHCMKDQMLGICEKLRSAANPVYGHSFRATSLETLRHMVATHSGVTLLPAMAKRKNDGITYVPFKNDRYARSIGLVWRPGSAYVSEIQDLCALLEKAGGQD